MRKTLRTPIAVVALALSTALFAATTIGATPNPVLAQAEAAEPVRFEGDGFAVSVSADAAISDDPFVARVAGIAPPEPEPTPVPEPTPEAAQQPQPAAAPVQPAPAPAAAPARKSGGTSNAAIFADLNVQRARYGLAPLTLHGGLSNLSQGWAQQMAASRSMYHNPSYRASTQAMGCSGGTENVAWTMGGGGSPVTYWMNSPPHRAAILNPNYTMIGVGGAKGSNGGSYYATNFAASC